MNKTYTSQKIVIHTTKIIQKTTLYIGRITRGKVFASVKLVVWIEKRVEDFFEFVIQPPEFKKRINPLKIF